MSEIRITLWYGPRPRCGQCPRPGVFQWGTWGFLCLRHSWAFLQATKCAHRSHRLGLPCWRECTYDGYCGRHNRACSHDDSGPGHAGGLPVPWGSWLPGKVRTWVR
jgi:hypothetical protein